VVLLSAARRHYTAGHDGGNGGHNQPRAGP
jgi:hypothetical protein